MPDWKPASSRGLDSSQTRGPSPIVQAAEKLVGRIESLVAEVSTLRAENAALRRDVREALTLFQQAGAAASTRVSRRAHAIEGQPVSAPGRVRGKSAAGAAPGRRRRRKAAKGRATPQSVTGEVVRAVLAKLGSATASEIAREITTAGAPVSGRAVRFLAERAGAQAVVGEDGQRRYRL